MMHIVHVTVQATHAGSGRAICSAARHLIAQGVRHTLISLKPAREDSHALFDAAGIRLVEQPSSSALNQLLREADIVRVEWWNNPEIVRFIHGKLPSMRLVLYLHNVGNHYPNVVTRELVDFSDFFVAGCRYAHQHGVLAALPNTLRQRKTGVVVATADFNRLADRERQAHDGFVVSYIGDLGTKKRHPNLVAMSINAGIKDARFIIRGKGDPEPLRREAARLERLHAAGHVSQFDIDGYCHDIASVLLQSDVFGYPLNIPPGAELSVQEAMYAGVVPVVFPLGGLNDLVIHEYTGLVVEDEAAYSNALAYLYRHPKARLRMASNAQHYAREMCSAKRSAEQWLIIYENLMRQPKRDRAWAEKPSCLSGLQEGVTLFLRTLDLLADDNPFLVSLKSKDIDAVLVAEKSIAKKGGAQVLHRFAMHFPKDGYLNIWAGLDYAHRGMHQEACEAFRRASRGGVRHWRVWFYQAVSAEKLGRFHEAHKLCQNVLDVALNFHPAMVILERLNSLLRNPQLTRVVLFSYPRSGNTWLRYVIEVLTRRPSIAPDNIVNDPPICVRIDGLDVDREAEPSAIKCHRLSEIDELEAEQPLVVVVRNYKECIVRNRYDLREHGFDFQSEHAIYLEPLRYYNDFTGPKLLIYYEELIQYPERIIPQLAGFLNVPSAVYDAFLNDYDAHFQRSLTGYPRSQTQGKKTSYHTNQLNDAQRLHWDQQMQTADAQLFGGYLSRYLEADFVKE